MDIKIFFLKFKCFPLLLKIPEVLLPEFILFYPTLDYHIKTKKKQCRFLRIYGRFLRKNKRVL